MAQHNKSLFYDGKYLQVTDFRLHSEQSGSGSESESESESESKSEPGLDY